MPRLTRRALLGGAAAAGAAVLGAGAWVTDDDATEARAWALRRLGLDGDDGVVPALAPGRVLRGTLRSATQPGRPGWALALPPGIDDPRGLPVAVVLHGLANDHASVVDRSYLAADRFLAAVVAGGLAPFAVASVDGGGTYWHPRADGTDASATVTGELLPLLARLGVRTDRVALLGWSMGGYGALLLAQRLGPARVAAVGAMSPALWRSAAAATPGAFDDEADLRTAAVLGRQELLHGIPVRVDCGLGDPFCPLAQEYAAGFAEPPAGGFERGDHDLGYWRRVLPRQLAFAGRALAG